jgi:hypothetical protein
LALVQQRQHRGEELSELLLGDLHQRRLHRATYFCVDTYQYQEGRAMEYRHILGALLYCTAKCWSHLLTSLSVYQWWQYWRCSDTA